REYLRAKRAQVLASLCGSDTISLDPVHHGMIDMEAVANRLAILGSTRRAGGVLVAEVEGHRLTIFPDGRALIRGVKDEAEARGVYAKYVGVCRAAPWGSCGRRDGGPRGRGRPRHRGELGTGLEPDRREPPGDRRRRAPPDPPTAHRLRQTGNRGSREVNPHLRGVERAGNLRSARAPAPLDPRAVGSDPHRGDEAGCSGARLFVSLEAGLGKVQGRRACCTTSLEPGGCRMSSYPLKPCRSATAFISTLTKSRHMA